MKKILALLLASLLLIGLFAGCAKQETAPVQQEQTTTTEPAPAEQPAEQPSEQPENTELPTITFVHGYYHDESEWAAAAQMPRAAAVITLLRMDSAALYCRTDGALRCDQMR